MSELDYLLVVGADRTPVADLGAAMDHVLKLPPGRQWVVLRDGKLVAGGRVRP
jgi:hypothetical protein